MLQTAAKAWFGGVGTYVGNTAVIEQVALPTGGLWIPNFDPNKIVRNPWGTLTFTFSDCNHGRVDFNSTIGGLRSRSHGLGTSDATGGVDVSIDGCDELRMMKSMKTTNTIGRSLHVLVLSLCGLSFYAFLLMLLVLIVELVVPTHAHAQAPGNPAGCRPGV